MDQRTIKALLEEAASPNCPWSRRHEIQCELVAASAAREPGCDDTDMEREEGLRLLLDMLYIDTIEHRPHLLPSLFPAFAIICGNRPEGRIVTNVEWQMM